MWLDATKIYSLLSGKQAWMKYTCSMTQTISVSCKLQVPPELRQEIEVTLKAFAKACNQILENHVCLRIGERNGKDFYCSHCQKHEDADWNAANVIGLLGQSVMLPELAANLSCLLQDVS